MSAQETRSPAYRFLAAKRLFESGRFASAEELASELQGDTVLGPHVLHLLGLAAAKRGDFDGATACIRKAIALPGAMPRFHQDLGNLLQDQGRLDRAISEYRKALRLDPKSAEALNDLGTAYHAKGWFDEAIECYQKAIKLDPRHAVAYGNLGACLYKHHRYSEARRYLAAELKLRLIDLGRRFVLGLQRRLSNPNRPSPRERALAARAYLDAGNGDIAELICRDILDEETKNVPALDVLGRALERSGNPEQALECVQRAVRLRPRDPELLVLLGNVLVKLGRKDEASASYEAALKLRPRFPKALNNLANLLLERGEVDAALANYREAVRLDPDYRDGWSNIALVLVAKGVDDEAERALRRALELDPNYFAALASLAELTRKQDRLVEAEAICRRLVELHPDDPRAHHMLGLVLIDEVHPEAAMICFREAIRLDPEYWRSHNNLGMILADLGRRDEAIVHLHRVLELNPDNNDVLLNLVRLYSFEEDFEEGMPYLERLHQRLPDDARVWNSMGTYSHAQGRMADAIREIQRAVDLDPELTQARVNLAHLLVEKGDLAKGWAEYDARLKLKETRALHAKLPMPRWDGGPLEGRSVLVYSEQGIGDEIMFSSCLPDLLKQADRCVVFCSRKLEPIFRRTFDGAEIVGCEVPRFRAPLEQLSPRPDLQVGMGSLAGFFRKSFDDFPRHQGFLRADAEKVRAWRDRLDALGPNRKVGISWKGGIHTTGQRRRTLGLERLLPILRTGNVDFVSLQYTECAEDIAKLKRDHGITVHHWQDAIDDYDQTAALVGALDLVVTVCTAIVHLTGALGKPAWVMAPFSPGWRYAMLPGGMPWYPSVRVDRQPAPGDWDPVIETVRARLVSWVSNASDTDARPLAARA